MWCGIPLTFETATLEHLIPNGKGGRLTFFNMGLACAHCNNTRGLSTVNDFHASEWLAKKRQSMLRIWNGKRYKSHNRMIQINSFGVYYKRDGTVGGLEYLKHI